MRLFILLLLFTLSFAKPRYRNIDVDTLILTCDTVTTADYVLVKVPDDTIRCLHIDSISGSGGSFNGTIDDMFIPYYVAAYDSFTSSVLYMEGGNAVCLSSIEIPFGNLQINNSGYIGPKGDYNLTQHKPDTLILNGKLRINGNIELGSNFISEDGESNAGLFLTTGNVFVRSSSNMLGDLKTNIMIEDTNSYDEGVGGGIAFLQKYNSGGSSILTSGISCYKTNAVDGDYSSQLHFQTRRNGYLSDTKMIIDEYGKVGINQPYPDSLLHVTGSGYISGNARFGTNVGIRTNDPEAILDVCYGGLGIVVGADNGTNSRTDSEDKYARIAFPHYTTSEQKGMFLYGLSTSTENRVHIGGGSTVCNAATSLRFYTAANNTTVQGTERMRIDDDGYVGIGTTTPDAELDVDGDIIITDNNYIGCQSSYSLMQLQSGTLQINGTSYVTGSMYTDGDIIGTSGFRIGPSGDTDLLTMYSRLLSVAGTADVDTLKAYCKTTSSVAYVLCKSATGDTVKQVTIGDLTNIILAENEVITDIRNASASPIENAFTVILIIFFLFQQVQINKLDERIKSLEGSNHEKV